MHDAEHSIGRNPNLRFFDPYANSSFAPGQPLVHEWKYIRSDFYLYRNGEPSPPFRLYLQEVLDAMGDLSDIQVGIH